MRRVILPIVMCIVSVSLEAKDVYLSISGTVGNFRTDTRIFNPSFTKDITVNAAFLEAGTLDTHPDNNGVTGKDITIPKRTMVMYDDVLASLFGITGKLGAIRLVSPDDFAATQRIYANESTGTLGQFVPGLSVGEARSKGVLLQMKVNGARGTRGTFRTNVGFVNPANANTSVTLRLYGKNNALVGAERIITLKPYGVISPSAVNGYFDVGTADISDSWMSYEATNPIFAYASILDNGTEDPTFIPAAEDTGVAPPAQPTLKTFNVTLADGDISISPSLAGLKVDENVVFRVNTAQGTHGFTLIGPDGETLIPSFFLGVPNGTVEKPFRLKKEGTHTYFCTNSACGIGHGQMVGTFVVGQASEPPGRGY